MWPFGIRKYSPGLIEWAIAHAANEMRLEEELYSLPDTPETNDRFNEIAARIWGEKAAEDLTRERYRCQNERAVKAAERQQQQ